MLFSLSSPHLEAFLYAQAQQQGGRERGREGGGLDLYREYLFHNRRYAEAMELLEVRREGGRDGIDPVSSIHVLTTPFPPSLPPSLPPSFRVPPWRTTRT